MLSYTLYESNTEKIGLVKELGLIENTIALERERYGKRLNISFEVVGEPQGILIPPLILVPFVENAFKHGLRHEAKQGWIKIMVRIQKESLYFEVQNSVPSMIFDRPLGGLGLRNASRRLELIYGQRQQLDIRAEQKRFTVQLNISFK